MPHELDRADWTFKNGRRHVFPFFDRLLTALHKEGLAVVPLAFAKSTQAVDMKVYTQVLAWKADAERRAATAEAELAALQHAFVSWPGACRSDGAHDHDTASEWRTPGEAAA